VGGAADTNAGIDRQTSSAGSRWERPIQGVAGTHGLGRKLAQPSSAPATFGTGVKGRRGWFVRHCRRGTYNDSPINQIDSLSTVVNPNLSYNCLPAGVAIR
jgi:hypothetical protein